MILAGKSAVVTGGAIRIGRELGQALAQAGVHVCLHYGQSAAAAQSAVREFQQFGVKVCAVSADLLNPTAAARDVFQFASSEVGPVQILINSAAIFETGTLLTTTPENWQRHLTINLHAPFCFTQEFVRQLEPNAEGAIVNLVDWRAERPVPGHAAYTMAKAGLLAQTRLLAQELGPNVRVNAIAPGAILPGPGDSFEQFRARGQFNSLKRTGSPGDVAQAMLYLLQSSFTTGEMIHVTGGEEL